MAVDNLPLPAAAAVATTEHYAALDAELFAYGARALTQAREGRPKNTNKAYTPKQTEFREFCVEKGFEDGEIVSENKVIWFLNERVLNREIRGSRYKRRKQRKTADGKLIQQTLGISAIKSYIASIVDLWSFQKSKGMNPHPSPRGKALNGLLRARKLAEHKRRRLEFTDRAAGTLLDGYNEVKLIEAIRFCWSKQKWLKQSTEQHLRTAMDFLHGHSMLLRGENRLAAELLDFFSLELPNEGPTPCHAMIMIMDNGKMNQQGRIEYAGVIRHRNPLLCTMGHTAFYLFYRWNITSEQPPSFRRRELWYNNHLLKGLYPDKQMAYDTLLDWINKMFTGAKVSSLKKVHAPRPGGAKHAELNGVAEGQIRRGGRWNNDALTKCYLTHLPRKFIRGMAGFNPSIPGNFYLPRAKVLPPRSLEQALWPFVDEWLAWFNSNLGADGAEDSDYDDDNDDDTRDLAAQGFLHLLQQLRTILLQDSVIMRKEFPDHPIWTDPIFHRDDYLAFARDVELSLMDVEEPEEIQIRKALPAIAERLSTIHHSLARDISGLGTEARQKLDGIQLNIADLLEGRISITLHTTPHHTAAVSSPPAPPTSTSASLSPTAPSSPPLLPQLLPQPSLEPQPSPLLPPLPTYLLSRAISTVPQLWREWTVGLGGGPSVQGLEDMYGPRWRPKHSEQVMYGRRKVIIDEIRGRQARGITAGAAVEAVELIRQRGQLSLYRLSQMLNKQRKCAS